MQRSSYQSKCIPSVHQSIEVTLHGALLKYLKHWGSPTFSPFLCWPALAMGGVSIVTKVERISAEENLVLEDSILEEDDVLF